MLRRKNEQKYNDGQKISEMLLEGELAALIELTGLHGRGSVPIFVGQETTLSLLQKATESRDSFHLNKLPRALPINGTSICLFLLETQSDVQ